MTRSPDQSLRNLERRAALLAGPTQREAGWWVIGPRNGGRKLRRDLVLAALIDGMAFNDICRASGASAATLRKVRDELREQGLL